MAHVQFQITNETEIVLSRRVERVNSLLQREIAVIIDREIDLPEGALVTVTRVETTADLKTAKVFVTVLRPGGDEAEVLKSLKAQTAEIRAKLAPAITFKFLPEILIREDLELRRDEKMRRLFADIEAEERGPRAEG